MRSSAHREPNLHHKLHSYLPACGAAQNLLPQNGIYAWYKSSNLGKSGNGGAKWASSVGKFLAKPTKGTVQTVTSTGFGAAGPVRAVQGSTSSSYTFGEILSDKYTICSLTRYTGGSRRRILTGSRSNWLHGHWNGGAGIAHYDGWIGSSKNQMKTVDDWVILCGSSNTVLLHGKKMGTRNSNVPGKQSVVINAGPQGGETSDWMVAEIITWNRALSEKEMQDATAYLQKFLDGETKPLSSLQTSLNCLKSLIMRDTRHEVTLQH